MYDHIEETIDEMPGSSGNQYSNLTPSQEEDWRDLFQLIAEEEFAAVAAMAGDLEYRLLRFIDNAGAMNREFFVLEKTTGGGHYWGTYVFRPDACRRLVIQCPHPRVDSNTGKQGIYVYQNSDAYAYFLSGTHRCNHLSPTACSGSTSVCGSNATYRRSDVAHNTLAGFHLATEVLYDHFEDLRFIQLHGFGQQSGDPFVIMSNGSRNTPNMDLAANIRDGLLTADPALTFKIGHLDLAWNRLLAFTNTQGRYINQSTDACTSNATTGNGRFLHIEQEYSRLRANEQQWAKMLTAVESAIGCHTVAIQESASIDPVFWFSQTDRALHFDLPGGGPAYRFVFFNFLGQVLKQQEISAQSTIFLPDSGPGFFSVWDGGRWVTGGKIF
ncbi:MAG: hypothetical protein DHS20C18_06140 [Saprospiraceae bacterium]|nr:MAG: hypothetical protein DHS20C18_06140 [Saprospiraceae bacterium]